MIHIDPATDLIDIPCPLRGDLSRIVIALIDEFFHTIFFDIFIRLESEFFLDFLLDRETMAVPSPYTIHTLPSHRPVASDNVLHDR